VRSLKELIDFNEKNRQREMPFFEQEKLIESESSGPLADPKYLRARADCVRLSRKEGIDALLAQHKLDAIVTLTSGPAWLIDPVGGDNFPSDCTTPAAVAGYPHITVPAGVYRALPVGLSFFGTAWTEPVLLKLAYSWEQQTKARPKPTFASTVSI
jgi:amidase